MKKIGSINAENKDAVAKQITATEMFATLIAPKKKNQCKATIAPTPINGSISFLLIFFICFLKSKKKKRAIKAINILCHTRYGVSSVISLPKTPVNPKKITIMCSDNSLLFFRI